MRTDIAERLVAAPPEDVFTALVDPEAVETWLPPTGMTGRIEQFDARPGGRYRLVLTYLDATAAPGKSTADSDVVTGTFTEITPGVRVVMAADFVSDDPAFAEPMLMTWEVQAVTGGTLVTMRAEQVPEPISPEAHVQGMTASLANLARYLEG